MNPYVPKFVANYFFLYYSESDDSCVYLLVKITEITFFLVSQNRLSLSMSRTSC